LNFLLFGVRHQPPGGVHGGFSAFVFIAVNVADDVDAGFLGGVGLAGDLDRPEIPFTPAMTDGVDFGHIRIVFGQLAHRCFVELEVMAHSPVDIGAFGGCSYRR
ncbi:MAG TPA: hypothetical protein PKD55_04425, partial [Bellilinea sp.]|nr:hypothetical protein [Bellilinea sp.]